MRHLLLALLVLLCTCVRAQDSIVLNYAALAKASSFTGSGSSYSGLLSSWRDVQETGYVPFVAIVGDQFIDSRNNLYRITSLSSPSASSLYVTFLALGPTPHSQPSGVGVVYRPFGPGFIPPLPTQNGQISIYLSHIIQSHNWKVQATAVAGGGRVRIVDALSDTTTVFNPPLEGDKIIKSDTSFIAHRLPTKWFVTYLNTTSGAGGPVDWDDLVNVPPGFSDNVDNTGISSVLSDATLAGTGITGSVLRVDTSIVSSRNFVINSINSAAEQQVEYTAMGGETTIVIPFAIDTDKPVKVMRNGVNQSVGSGKLVTLAGTTFTFNSAALSAGEYLQIYLYRL
jgi:hypothetical protein